MVGNPMSDIRGLADEDDMLAKVNTISLGQGVMPKAIAGIKVGGQSGNWVLLRNCRLAQSFMATSENLVEELHPEECNLWLITCSSPADSHLDSSGRGEDDHRNAQRSQHGLALDLEFVETCRGQEDALRIVFLPRPHSEAA